MHPILARQYRDCPYSRTAANINLAWEAALCFWCVFAIFSPTPKVRLGVELFLNDLSSFR